jgi:hypothetical protein
MTTNDNILEDDGREIEALFEAKATVLAKDDDDDGGEEEELAVCKLSCGWKNGMWHVWAEGPAIPRFPVIKEERLEDAAERFASMAFHVKLISDALVSAAEAMSEEAYKICSMNGIPHDYDDYEE